MRYCSWHRRLGFDAIAASETASSPVEELLRRDLIPFLLYIYINGNDRIGTWPRVGTDTYCTMKIEIPNNLVISFFFISFCVYISTLVDVGFFWHIE